MTIILFFIVLIILIVSHEFGHFIVAKLSGIRVIEFGLGLPPRIWGKKFGDTLYSVNWLPFGGFVKIFGEDGDEREDGEGMQDNFASKPALIQAAVVLAGIVFNLILAFILLWVGLQAGMPVSVSNFPNYLDNITNQRTIITGLVPGSPADKAELPVGVIIESLAVSDISDIDKADETRILNPTPESVSAFLAKNRDKNILINNQSRVTPDSSGLLGIKMDLIGDAHLSAMGSLPEAIRVTWLLTKGTVVGLAGLIGSAIVGEASLENVTGPVGIAGIVGEAGRAGLGTLLFITAILSISLAVINLVPFPALDGGRLLFIIIEKIKGSPMKKDFVNVINTFGFGLLILLMFVITYKDVLNLWGN